MWLFLMLFSLIFFAGIEIFYKIYTEKNPHVSANATSLVTNFFMIFWAIPFVFFAKSSFELSNVPWPLLIGDNLMFVAGVALYYESYKVIPASIGTILGTSSVLITTFLGILFFHESVTLSKFAGIALILLAIALVNFEKSKPHIRGYLYAFFGGMVFGLAYMIDKYIVSGYKFDVDHFQLINPLIAIPLKAMLQPFSIVKEIKKIKKNSLIFSIAAALCIILAYKLTYTAYTLGAEVGKADAINNLAIFVIIAAEMIFLKDRRNIGRKLISAGLAIGGIWLLR